MAILHFQRHLFHTVQDSLFLNVLSFITILFYKNVYGEIDGNFLINF